MLSRETFLLVFLLITIICSVFIYSALGILPNTDFQCPTVISNATIESTPSISIFTDKIRYIQGELVQVSGKVCDKEGKPSQEKIIIQSSKLPTDNWFLRFYQIVGEKLRLSDKATSKPEIVYKTSIFSINGSYADNILNTQSAGSYNITSTIANLNETSFTKIGVINPFATSAALTGSLGIASFVLLLLLPGYLLKRFGILNGIHVIEKVIFLLLTTFIFSLIFALSLADIELGPNSPLGLVLQHPFDTEGQVTKGGQWIINVGGHPNNNYTDGIAIPVYILVFGIVGGFIRYLYETATSHREETKKELKKIEDEIKEENKGKNNSEQLVGLSSEIRRYFLYKALKNLALMMLAPLLAIAVWLLLVQVGIQGQQVDVPGQGQTGIFILATISFTVGLITDEVIQILTRFTKDRLGIETENKKILKPSQINVAKNPVKKGEEQTIEIIISNKDGNIDDAIVKGKVTNPSEPYIENFKGLTNNIGKYSYTWPINVSPGIYTVNLDISAKDYQNTSFTTIFVVTD